MIVDIGGRSTELIYDNKKKIHVESINLGVVSLNESYLSQNPVTKTDEELAIQFINNNFTSKSLRQQNNRQAYRTNTMADRK